MNLTYILFKIQKTFQNSIALVLAVTILATSFLGYKKVAPSELPVGYQQRIEFLEAQMTEKEKESLATNLAKKYKVSLEKSRLFVDTAYLEAQKFPGVSPFLILAIIEKESSLKDFVTNSYGAVGLMQVVPRWHPEKLKKDKDPVVQLKNPVTNIKVGSLILAEYLRKNSGDLRKALIKYSGNASNYSEKVIENKENLKKIAKESRESFLYPSL